MDSTTQDSKTKFVGFHEFAEELSFDQVHAHIHASVVNKQTIAKTNKL